MKKEKLKIILLGCLLVGGTVFGTILALSSGPFAKANKSWFQAAKVEQDDPLSMYQRRNVAIADEALDTDNDGLDNKTETVIGTDPWKVDTDGDRIMDSLETNQFKTNPLLADTDGDGFSDSEEVANGFDPTDSDPNAKTGDEDGGPTDKVSIYFREIDAKLAAGEDLTTEDLDIQKKIGGEFEVSEESIRGTALRLGMNSSEVRDTTDLIDISDGELSYYEADTRQYQLEYAAKLSEAFDKNHILASAEGQKSVRQVIDAGDTDSLPALSTSYSSLAQSVYALRVPPNQDFIDLHKQIIKVSYGLANLLGDTAVFNAGPEGMSFILSAASWRMEVQELLSAMIFLKGKYSLPIEIGNAQAILQGMQESAQK